MDPKANYLTLQILILIPNKWKNIFNRDSVIIFYCLMHIYLLHKTDIKINLMEWDNSSVPES